MRRAERAVTDFQEQLAIIKQCAVCRLAMVDNGQPYIVPLNFGYETEGEKLRLYFHCADAGRKVDILRKNPAVCFEMDRDHALLPGPSACGYSFRYESVIGTGAARFLDRPEDKIHALGLLMCQMTGRDDFSFEENQVGKLLVFAVDAREPGQVRTMLGALVAMVEARANAGSAANGGVA